MTATIGITGYVEQGGGGKWRVVFNTTFRGQRDQFTRDGFDTPEAAQADMLRRIAEMQAELGDQQ